MKIEWNKVTWYSEVLAIIVCVGIMFVGIRIGQSYESVVLCTDHGVCVY